MLKKWIFNQHFSEFQSNHQQWLSKLDMLPISEAMFAKRFKSNSELLIDWILFDVYKIAASFPLVVSVYGFIHSNKTGVFKGDEFPTSNQLTQNTIDQRIQITDKFQSKSVRDDLQGLKLKCGLVVCILVTNCV